jgi:hypothetical protein
VKRVGRSLATCAAVALLIVACTRSNGSGPSTSRSMPATGPASASPSAGSPRALAREVCAGVAHELLLRTWRGTRPDRSGDIQLIAEEPNFVDGGLTHAGPWDYVQDVPLFLYGPGYVERGVYERPVTLADVAPTAGRMLDFPFDAPDGKALEEALPESADGPPPRLLVTLVWDSAGRDVLDAWPEAWPYLRSLLPDGAWFERATVGASPSNTPTGHATLGTGSFPMRHGFVDEFIRMNGKLQKPNENGPGFLLQPTLADLYDLAMGNEPIVGAVATLAAHISMMGHGSMWGDGDRDIAVTREKEDAETGGAESVSWNLTSDMAPFYRLPGYVNQIEGFEDDVAELDRADGALDGKWRDNSIAQLVNGFDTPARTPFQSRLVRRIVAREGFGDDEVPDLLYLNYKAIDTIGHRFSLNSLEMADAVRVQDDDLAELVAFLDREVGRGMWAMILTADHGTNFDPEVSGAFRIDIDRLSEAVAGTFDDDDGSPLLEKVRPTEIWLNTEELRENGHSLTEVSRFIVGLTQSDTVKPTLSVQPGHEDDEVFAAAFPSSILSSLPCLPEARAS